MTPQELPLLEDLLQRLTAVHGVQKDPQAGALISERLRAQPDALYLLVQRTLLLEHALEDMRRELAQRTAVPADGSSAAFLQRGLEPGFGREPVDPDAYNPGRAADRGAPTMAASAMAPPAAAPAPGWRERFFGAAPATAPASSSQPGFLGQAATTAAGVAGGMFLFNGIEHLLGGHGGLSGSNGSSFLGLGAGDHNSSPTEATENVTQNFYDDGSSRSGDIRQLADDAGAGWSGFDDGAPFDDDQIV
jgi:hypothetical protein